MRRVSRPGTDRTLLKMRPQLAVDADQQDTVSPLLRGEVDVYTYRSSWKGWLFLGWVSQEWEKHQSPSAVAQFKDQSLVGAVEALFYERADLQSKALGCVLFMPSENTPLQDAVLLSLGIEIGELRGELQGRGRNPVSMQQFIEALPRGVLDEVFRAGLDGDDHSPGLGTSFDGHIDFFGYHQPANGWVLCGWVSEVWNEENGPTVIAHFIDSDIAGHASVTFYRRDDVAGRGIGIIAVLRSNIDKHTRLSSVELEFPGFAARIPATAGARYFRRELVDAVRPLFDAEIEADRAGVRSLLLGRGAASDTYARQAVAGKQGLAGHVDFYGFRREFAAGILVGWVARPFRDADKPTRAVALFKDGVVSGEALAAFYFREDVAGCGVGFILVLNCPDRDEGDLISLTLEFPDFYASLQTTAKRCLTECELADALEPMLRGTETDSNWARLRTLLDPKQVRERRSSEPEGFVDFYGHHSPSRGWLFCGWVSAVLHGKTHPFRITAHFEHGEVCGEAATLDYAREDVIDGRGIVAFIPGADTSLGGLLSLEIEHDPPVRMYPSRELRRLSQQDLVGALRRIITGAAPGEERENILAILARKRFDGADTLGELKDRVLLELDEAIFCEPDGIVLIGWHFASPGVLRYLRLRCGDLVSDINLDEAIRIDRPDVLEAVGPTHGLDDLRCGFLVFVPHSVDGINQPYLEIGTMRGEIGYRNVPVRSFSGLAAIKRILQCFDVRFLDVPPAFEKVIGPAIDLLNRSRLQIRPKVSVLEFGDPALEPEFSVIIPLYGRIDFLEYQLALFSSHQPKQEIELIYVLDDPSKRRDAQYLFTSAYRRFRIPFRGLLLDRNVGFAPANNVGLQYARGKYVCFLNSDVFPGTPNWLEHLASSLAAHPGLGAIGPLLIYDDGAVQHQGMCFRRLSEFGGWFFGHHYGKGAKPSQLNGLQECMSITGACMLMERTTVDRLHGFDESYVVGDFEDSDLCLRLQEKGLRCAVDLDVRLYHLERKSQTTSGENWRLNLTLYNAWVHQRRWSQAISSHPRASGPVSLIAEAAP